MKVALIGGSSFIGRNLILFLKKKKIYIIATYKNQRKNIIKSKYVKWKRLDISKEKLNYLKFLGYPDIIINLAWADIPNYLSKNHLKTYLIQNRFLKNLIRNGLQNLIVLGTCYEYGNVKGKVSEDKICKPTIPYSIAKLRLLKNILKYKKKYNFKFTWLRPFFVYGLNKKRKTLYSIIKDIDNGKKIRISVPGKLNRDFVSIDYLCNVILKIINLDKDIGILNLCSGKKKSIRDFIYENLKNKNKIKNINMNGKNSNSFEPSSFWGNNQKLKKIMNTKKSSDM